MIHLRVDQIGFKLYIISEKVYLSGLKKRMKSDTNSMAWYH